MKKAIARHQTAVTSAKTEDSFNLETRFQLLKDIFGQFNQIQGKSEYLQLSESSST